MLFYLFLQIEKRIKIMTEPAETSAEQLSKMIIEGVQDKKGKDIVSLNLSNIPNAVCSYFIVCHGTSSTQIGAIADSVMEKVKLNTGENPWHKEGFENAEWILIDYVDVVLHIFQKSVRDFYQLEELWADAEIQQVESEA